MMKLHSIFLLAALLFLSSCAAPNFNRQWEQALAETGPPYTKVTGPWEGEWISYHNQHQGKLRAIVREAPGENHYDFLYWATWGGMKGTFRFKGEAEKGDRRGTMRVTGSKNLGFIRYNHNAVISPTEFKATYGSTKKDHGKFELERPE